MSRGWVLMDEEGYQGTEAEYEQLSLRADILAKEWSRLHDENEQETFRLRAEEEDGFYEPDYDPDDALTMIADDMAQQMRWRAREAQMTAIDEQLAEIGCRMMRPYEHWNEDEQLMEYLERNRD